MEERRELHRGALADADSMTGSRDSAMMARFIRLDSPRQTSLQFSSVQLSSSRLVQSQLFLAGLLYFEYAS